MAILDLISGGSWRWLALALVALGGASIGWLAGPGSDRPPVVRRRIRVDTAGGADPTVADTLSKAIGRALVRRAPEIDMVILGVDDGSPCDLRVVARRTEAGVTLTRADSAMTLTLTEPLGSMDAGAEAAAFLLSQWPDAPTARAIVGLTGHTDRFEMRVLAAAAHYRLPRESMSRVLDQEARRLIESWPSGAPEADQHRLASALATSLIAETAGPATAVRVYLALQLAAEALEAHWAAGRLDEATEARHLIARIRLTLARAEGEPMHLEAAREEIAHVMAFRPRTLEAERRSSDLVLAAAIERAAADHEPGTSALERAATHLRHAHSAQTTQPHELGSAAALAGILTELGTRLASPARLREAIATARNAVRAGAPPLLLAQPLLTLGRLLGDARAIEEASVTARSDESPHARGVEAEALSTLGAIRSDTATIAQGLALWRTLEAVHPRPANDRRRHAQMALLAGRYAMDRRGIDEAVTVAETLLSMVPASPIAQALDRLLLAEALRARSQLGFGTAADTQRERALLDEAIAAIADESLPRLRARLSALRRSVEGQPDMQATSAPSATSFERALTAVALRLGDGSAAALAASRRTILALIDDAASLDAEPHLAIALQWLERIERAMMERL